MNGAHSQLETTSVISRVDDLKPTNVQAVFWSIAVGLTAALWWLSPLLVGDYINHGHDVVSHIRWSEQFSAALFEGFMRPQWLSEEGYGFGKPSFVTYSPAFYYAAALGQAITGDVWTGMKLSSWFFLALCGTFVHLFLRTRVAPIYSILGTLAVLGSPMIIVSLYNYTGFPTFASFGPMAAVLYFTFRDYPENRPSVGLAISFLILTLTHILAAGMLAIVLGLGLLMNAIVGQADNKLFKQRRAFFHWTASALVGLLLASFYLVPALFYSQQGLFILHESESAFIDWRRGFSLPIFTQFFFELFWATFQWYIPGIYILGVFLITYSLKVEKVTRDRVAQQVGALWGAALVAIFFTTELSYPLWASISYLQVLQWPWRFLITLGLIVPLGIVLVTVWMKHDRLIRLLGIACLLIGVLFSGAKLAQLVVEDLVVDRADSWAPERSLSRYAESLDHVLAYRDNGGFDNECRKRDMLCEEEQILSHRKSWIITAPSAESIRLPVFYYPGWSLAVNDKQVALRHDPQTGLLLVNLDTGVNRVVLEWAGMPIQWISNALSILAMILVIVWVACDRINKSQYHR